MKFKSRLSKGQIGSIILLILGLIVLFGDIKIGDKALMFIGLTLVILSISGFIQESIKRYQILKPFKTNRYDSKAEEKIANYFKRKNIIYHHHHQIKVPKPFFKIFSFPFVNIQLEPDFFLPEFNVFVEYWGLINDPEYKKNAYDVKKKLYKDNALDFISLYPKNLKNLDFVFTSKLLDVLKEREGNDRLKR